MIAKIDEQVGRIRAALEKNGLDKNTIILFTSDNGTTFLKQVDVKFFNSVGALRGLKSTCYEGGIRMPMIAWWPGKIKAGTSSDQFMYACDFTPTLGTLAGFDGKGTDGVDVSSTWTQGVKRVHPPMYFEFPEGIGYQAVILQSRYKVILPDTKKGNKKVEVYDLINDPNEKVDLSATRQDLVAQGKQMFISERFPNKTFPLAGIDTPPVVPRKASGG
jgi:arylsulfatase